MYFYSSSGILFNPAEQIFVIIFPTQAALCVFYGKEITIYVQLNKNQRQDLFSDVTSFLPTGNRTQQRSQKNFIFVR